MNILAQSCDYVDLKKILLENCKEIMSLLYNNNLAVIGLNSGTKL